MQLTGKFIIHESIEKVWDVVVDPLQLGACIPGCEQMQKIDETHYEATISVKIQFMTLKFHAKGELVEAEKPTRLVIAMNGKPFALAGIFQAELEVLLLDKESETEVSYQLQLQMTGRLASLGEAIMRKTVEQSAKEFSDNLKSFIEREVKI